MSNVLNLSINQGEDFSRVLTLKSDPDTLIDLTGYTFKGQAREAYGKGTVAFEFDFTVLNQTTNKGEVLWTLSNTVLSPIPLKAPKSYVYDVEMSGGGAVVRIIQGTATVNPEVTK